MISAATAISTGQNALSATKNAHYTPVPTKVGTLSVVMRNEQLLAVMLRSNNDNDGGDAQCEQLRKWGVVTTHSSALAAHPLVQRLVMFVDGEAPFPAEIIAIDDSFGPPQYQRIWQIMRQIPVGRVTSYQTLATQAGTSPRVVGGACKHNPLAIITPCHRVIDAAVLNKRRTSERDVGNYAGGAACKALLLRREGVDISRLADYAWWEHVH